MEALKLKFSSKVSMSQCKVLFTSYTTLLHIAVFADAMINPLPDQKNLDCSKLNQITDDILRCI